MQSSASCVRLRAACRIAWPPRSASSTRLGRPVSASRVARYSMRASACLRGVTSARGAAVADEARRLASRTGTALTDCQITPPELVMTRCTSSRKAWPSGAWLASHSCTARSSPSGMKSCAPAPEQLSARGSRAPPRRAPRGRCSATRVGLPHVLAGGLRHVAEALLALGERRLGALVLVDVGDRARGARGASRAVALGDPAASRAASASRRSSVRTRSRPGRWSSRLSARARAPCAPPSRSSGCTSSFSSAPRMTPATGRGRGSAPSREPR